VGDITAHLYLARRRFVRCVCAVAFTKGSAYFRWVFDFFGVLKVGFEGRTHLKYSGFTLGGYFEPTLGGFLVCF
jgi:hypothetical protein